jgi:anti-sigma factor RsiW
MSHGLEIDCQDLVELVTEYLHGELPKSDRVRFEEHLALCDGCDTYLEQLRETVRLTGTLAPEQIAPQSRDSLLVAFRGWKAARESRSPAAVGESSG